MFGIANVAYFAVAAATIVVGLIILKLVSVQAARPNHVVSQTTGYAAIFAILLLWSIGFVTLGAAFDLNPYLLSH